MSRWFKALGCALFLCMPGTVGWAQESDMDAANELVDIETRLTIWHENQDNPEALLHLIDQRNARLAANPQDGLIPFSLLQPFRDGFNEFKSGVYDVIGLRLGMSIHTVGQSAAEVLPGAEDHAWATDFDFVGTWELINQGTPYQGELFFGIEGRWDYNTIGPQNIGFASLGTTGGTANSFSGYYPEAFIVRNLYWRQGSKEAGWEFRIGKITVDSIFAGTAHLSPNAAFLPNAGTGLFVDGFADSGPGAVGTLYFGDDLYLSAGITDANGNRYTWGRLQEGDFWKAVELGIKIFPQTENAPYTKFTLWHTDGTYDGKPINANTGSDGFGYSILYQQELTADGNVLFIGRYGQSYDDAAIYDRQAGGHLVWYQPTGWFDSEALGVGLNWIDSAFPGTRDEVNLEAFYKFPLFPDVDTTFSYQHIHHPGATTLLESADVFSVRLTTSF